MTQDNDDSNMFNQDYKSSKTGNFTDRELDILSCIISGRTSRKSIASSLNISTATVASYMRSIMQKIECSSWEHVRAYIESTDMVDLLRDHFKNNICANSDVVKSTQSFLHIIQRNVSQTENQSKTINILKSFILKPTRTLMIGSLIIFVGIILVYWNCTKSGSNYIRSEIILPENKYLLQRDDLVKKIKSMLFEKIPHNRSISTVSLVGIGGAGKTTIARMIAQQHKGLTWELNAESKATLMASFRKLAYYSARTKEDKERIEFIQRIPAPIEQELQLVLFIKDKIRSHPGWLLIYDNIESIDDLMDYFPFDSNVWGTGAIIVTTRNENLKVGFQLKIGELTRNESIKLFCMTTNSLHTMPETEKDALGEFLQNLPPFPLDISIAGHYLSVTNLPREEYLRNFYQKTKQVEFKTDLIDEYNYTQTRDDILNLALTRLMEENPNYLGLLVVISSLDSQNIPIELCEGFEKLTTVQKFIRQLKKASLITVSSKKYGEKQSISIHRTIQTYIFSWLRSNDLVKKEALNHHMSKLIRMLEKTIHDYIRVENYGGLLEISPHVNKMLTTPELPEQDKIILYAAYYCLLIDFDQQAISQLETMSNLVNQLSIESNSYRYLLTLSYYGRFLYTYGRYAESIRILEKSLDLLYKNYPNSIEYYRALRVLGVAYRVIGRYREAQMCFDSCKKVFELFPSMTREKAEILAQIGLILRDTGKYRDAQKYLQDSVDIIAQKNAFLEKILQPYFWLQTICIELGYYPEVIMSFDRHLPLVGGSGLQWGDERRGYQGVPLYHLGKYEQALEFLEKSYLWDMEFGYMQNYNSFKGYLPILGKIYIHFKRYQDARSVLEKCLSYSEQLYGKNKFQNARIICYLGDLELAEGHLDLAESQMMQSYTLMKDVDHTDMYIPLESLAGLYKQKYEQAQKLQKKVEQEKYYETYKQYLAEANKIIQERFPSNSEHVKRIRKKLKELH